MTSAFLPLSSLTAQPKTFVFDKGPPRGSDDPKLLICIPLIISDHDN